MKERLRPTPVHAHYVFSLHDVARVVQGILLMSPRSRIRKMRTKKKAEREEASKCGTCFCLHQFLSIAGNMMYTSKCGACFSLHQFLSIAGNMMYTSKCGACFSLHQFLSAAGNTAYSRGAHSFSSFCVRHLILCVVVVTIMALGRLLRDRMEHILSFLIRYITLNITLS